METKILGLLAVALLVRTIFGRLCLAVGLAIVAPAALAVPMTFDVRYEFTTDDAFLAAFGVQETVSGVARYTLDQADQLSGETHSGLYDLISHRIRIDGHNATASNTSFGTFINSFETGNDLGFGGPPPYTDIFSFGSTFNQTFGAGLTLTEVRIFGLDETGVALSSDALFAIDPSDWNLQGMIRFLPAGSTAQPDQIAIFGFHLDSIRVTPVPEPGTLALLGLGLAGLGVNRRRTA